MDQRKSFAKPDEEAIETLLRAFQPRPGERFYARMAGAPWQGTAASAGATPRSGRIRLRRAGLAALALVIVLAIFFTLPPLQGTAYNFFQLFRRRDSDTLPLVLRTPSPPGPDFSLTIPEAEALAGFPVRQAENLPDGFVFNAAAYDPERQAVMLDYTSPLAGNFLRIVQIKMDESTLNVGSIGASAPVRLVAFQNAQGATITGEYVTGAWSLPSISTALEHSQPSLTVTMQASWDPQANIHMLLWQSEGILYEIIHADATAQQLHPDTLIRIAESMR